MRRAFVAAHAALLLTALNACGGGGAGSSSPPPPPPLPTGSNVAPLIVDAGPAQLGANLPSVTVTVCDPGTSNCWAIDHILVDTGSSGLRLMANAPAYMKTKLNLPSAKTTAGDPIYECFAFADGESWGSVRLADVRVADGKAAALKVELIGDPTVAPSASGCTGSQDDYATFGANGVLGVSVFVSDCGVGCDSTVMPGGGQYYVCPSAPCTGTAVAPQDQVLNPVSQFPTNNNGVAVVLPAITAVGAPTVEGALVLGIDTQSNNQLGSALVLSVGPNGNFTTVYKGTTYTMGGSIDSGSNGNFFNDSSLKVCTSVLYLDWYCPANAASLSATNQGAGASSATSTVNFSVASIEALSNANASFAAFNNIAGNIPISIQGFLAFDWGLPFFFGRTVSVAFEGKPTAAGNGPFFAYADFK